MMVLLMVENLVEQTVEQMVAQKVEQTVGYLAEKKVGQRECQWVVLLECWLELWWEHRKVDQWVEQKVLMRAGKLVGK